MGWVSQTTYVPAAVWGNGGKPGPQPPPELPFASRAPAPVVEEDKDDKE